MKLYQAIDERKTCKESYEHVKKLHKEDPELFLSPEEWVKLHKERHKTCSISVDFYGKKNKS